MTDRVSESAAPRRAGIWSLGAGLLAAGMAALVIALVRSTEPARTGLPVWVWVAVVAVLVAGVGVVVPRWRPSRPEPWTNPAWWRVGLAVGAVVVGTWAVLACVADIRSGLPGPAIPWLAVGCVALLVAAVLLSMSSPAPVRRGSVVRQALPAVLALVTVVGGVVAVDVVGWRIPVDATTAEGVDPVDVPDLPGRVRWTSTWPIPRIPDGRPNPIEPVTVVAAGAGVVVTSGDRVVALDGSTGAERWHYRRAGARIYGLKASTDGDTVVAEIAAGGEEISGSELFVFDADTGELRWTRPSEAFAVLGDVLIEQSPDEDAYVAVDLDSGEEVWIWTPPSNCELNGSAVRSRITMLVPVICREPGGHRYYALLGVDGRFGSERWRHTGPPVRVENPFDAELTTSPDGEAAMYKPFVTDDSVEPVVLRATLGDVVFRAPDNADIVGYDRHHVVLRHSEPDAHPLVFRHMRTGPEHPLANCPVLERPDSSDAGAVQEESVVIPGFDRAGKILTLCFDGREGATPRADIDVYSPDGTRLAAVDVAGEVGAIRDGSVVTGLLAVDGAVVLVVQHEGPGPAVLVGLG